MFEVGDLIIGNNRNDYDVTHKGSICFVLGKDGNHVIRVCVVADNVEEYERIKDRLILIPETFTKYETFWVFENAFDSFKKASPEFILNGLFFRKDLKKLVILKNTYVSNTDDYIRIGEV